jgi:hypothetical protein
LVGVVVAAVSVAAITGVNYGLRAIAPAVSTGVVYLLAVFMVSTYWMSSRRRCCGPSRITCAPR